MLLGFVFDTVSVLPDRVTVHSLLVQESCAQAVWAVMVSNNVTSSKAPIEREKSDARIGSSEHEVARLKVMATLRAPDSIPAVHAR